MRYRPVRVRLGECPIIRGKVEMSDKTVHSWKADPECERLLKALKRAKVEKSESSRVRAGLVMLATANGVEIPEGLKV